MNDTKMTKYFERVRALEASPKRHRESPFYTPLTFTMLEVPCGCAIQGDGNLPLLLYIKFCPQHAAVSLGGAK